MTGITDFRQCTVLVLGDVMLDRYVSGDAIRLSPEAPIPVLRWQGSRDVLGGAANVAKNVASLGARAILIGVVGDDGDGDVLEAAASGSGSEISARLTRAAGRPTTVKTRFMSGQHQILRLDREATSPISHIEAEAVLDAFGAALGEADVVVLSDYAKGVLCDGVLGRAIHMAGAAGLPVIADPKRASFSAYAGVSVLTPNEAEVALATGVQAKDDAGAEEAGRLALDASGAGAVLVTRSERGLTLVRRGARALHLPAETREVSDVSGAGDTLVAALAVTLAAGGDLPDSAAIANMAAGIAVGKQGTASVTWEELSAAIHRHKVRELDSKTCTIGQATVRIAAWRAEGLRVGFTNGCFDLIHPGHVRLLREARARCDRLVVGLNTDASVKRLKGSARPVQNEAARATVLGSMAATDMVIRFGEDTPLSLIEAIQPDVLFKGADYRPDQVVGAGFVRSRGGSVVLIDLEDGMSTSDIISRMAPALADAA